MTLTGHAETRMQQRGIPPLIVDWLVRFGRAEHCQGAEMFYFDRESRRRLRNYIGSMVFSRMHEFLDAYIVVDNDRILTAGHHYSKFRRA